MAFLDRYRGRRFVLFRSRERFEDFLVLPALALAAYCIYRANFG